MSILHLELTMGAAGDMLLGALYELLPDKEALLKSLNSLRLPGVAVAPERSVKCGVTGTHMRVTVRGEEERSIDIPAHGHTHAGTDDHTHSHRQAEQTSEAALGYYKILDTIASLELPEKVKADAGEVYRLLGDAEARVHGAPLGDVHFHEIGTLDALADIIGVCLAIYLLKPDKITATAVSLGSGYVKCAHGVVPVPAPATALLLQSIPVARGDVEGELTTPTGAALLSYFVDEFDTGITGSIKSVGYGMGSKDFIRLNAVRAFLVENKTEAFSESDEPTDEIVTLSTNIDDMTGEDLGFAAGALFNAGALDVYFVPIQMKKFRPGVMLCVMCKTADAEKLTRVIFKYTSTLGVRTERIRRAVLNRGTREADGKRIKLANGWGVTRSKAEYEDRVGDKRE